MAGEEWARRIIQKELGREVFLNDDGSRNAMYDLRIGPPDAPEIAIEVVGAVDPTYTETWNVGPAKGPLKLSIEGNWIVEIAPTARVKDVKRGIEHLLKRLERDGVYTVDAHSLSSHSALFDEISGLQVTNASCNRISGSGKVYLTMPGICDWVDDKGDEVPEWLDVFLRDPARKDVLLKLQHSGASYCHVFVIVTSMGATEAIELYLTGSFEHIPSKAPDLPPPITGAWLVSSLGCDMQKALYWDAKCWRLVQARGEGIDDKPLKP